MDNELLYQAGKTGTITINGKELKVSSLKLKHHAQILQYGIEDQGRTNFDVKIYKLSLFLRENEGDMMQMLLDLDMPPTLDGVTKMINDLEKEIESILYPPQIETES